MTQPTIKLDYGSNGEAVPGRRLAFTSPLDFEATALALEKAIVAADLWVLHRIETQMLLAKGGYEIRPLRQLLFFHPRYMARLLTTNSTAIVEVPLKFVIMAFADGSVRVLHPDIRTAFASYSGLADLGAELADVVDQITSSLEATAPA
ncbi:MAG: DUF302 domain-containing protein [Hyphomicrobiaceae bacterium]|nr:DUF302 domain-containing protein [Hyphomicrobiaceae bacterium]